MGDGLRDDVRSLGTKELRGAPSVVRGAVKTDGLPRSTDMFDRPSVSVRLCEIGVCPLRVTDGVENRGSIVLGVRADGIVTRGVLLLLLVIVGDEFLEFAEVDPRLMLKGAGARTVDDGATVLGL